jgi:hypothetical protein
MMIKITNTMMTASIGMTTYAVACMCTPILVEFLVQALEDPLYYCYEEEE